VARARFAAKVLNRTLHDSSRNGPPRKAGPTTRCRAREAATALAAFQVQSLANHKEQRGIMPSVETIGVGRGGSDAGDLRGVRRGLGGVSVPRASWPAAGSSSEGRE